MGLNRIQIISLHCDKSPGSVSRSFYSLCGICERHAAVDRVWGPDSYLWELWKGPQKKSEEKWLGKGESVLHLHWVISSLSYLSLPFPCPLLTFMKAHLGEANLLAGLSKVASKQRWREGCHTIKPSWRLHFYGTRGILNLAKGPRNPSGTFLSLQPQQSSGPGLSAESLASRLPGQYSHFTFSLLKYFILIKIAHLGLWWEENNFNNKTPLSFSPLSAASWWVRSWAKYFISFKEEAARTTHWRSIVCFSSPHLLGWSVPNCFLGPAV